MTGKVQTGRALRYFGFISYLWFLPLVQVVADEGKVSGHAKLQLTHSELDQESLLASAGPDSPTDGNVDLRLNYSKRWEKTEFEIAGEYLGQGGDSFQAIEAVRDRLPGFTSNQFPNDDRRLFRLTEEGTSGEDFGYVARLDRLFVGQTSENLVARVGRQAISWGDGLLFQVFDLFNPFSPIAIDKDYKTGDDLLYLQWLQETGGELQFLLIPRRDPVDDSIESDRSSYALKWHDRVEGLELEYDLLAAAHYGETVIGAGVSHDVMDAVWRLDVSLTDLEQRGIEPAVVTNLDRTWEVFGKNVYGYAEYYRSAVGVGSDDYGSLDLDDDITDRLSRGELFTLGRDYIGAGVRLEWTPLINLFSNTIFNLHDESGIHQFRINYDIVQDVLLMFGVNVPYGPSGSEFGGFDVGPRTTADASDTAFIAPATTVYCRVSFYF